jgi:hypothetical protein
MTNLTKLPGGESPDEFKEAIRQMRKSMETMPEYMELTSRMRKLKYEALVKEGFSHEDAIELCKDIF